MESLNRRYIRQVDEIRALAALLVLFYHVFHQVRAASGNTAWPITEDGVSALLYEGHTGVSLFMVLSGYILASGTLGSTIDYWRFLKNRLLRVFPLMALVLVFAAYGSKTASLSSIIAPFMFLQNTPIAFADTTNLSGPVWTISVEFQFYLVAPFVFAFTAHRGIDAFLLPLFALIFILKMMVLLPNSEDPGRLMYVSYYTIVGRMGQFLIGVGLAYVGVHHPAAARRRTRWIMVGVGMCGILVLMTALNRDGGVTAWRGWHAVLPEMEGLFWALFIAGYVGANPLRGRLGSSFAFVGKRSFSLYILHWPVLKLAMQLNAKYGFLPIRHVWPSFALWMIVLLPPLLGLIWLSFRCIEEPFLGLRGRYIKGAEPLQKDRILLLDQSQHALAGD